MHRKALTVAVLLVLATSVREASAQVGDPWTERGYFNLNIAFGGSSGSFVDARTFRLYDDDGSLEVATSFDSGPMFDFAIGARVWRNVSLGIGFHTGGSSGDGVVVASVPSPAAFKPIAMSPWTSATSSGPSEPFTCSWATCSR